MDKAKLKGYAFTAAGVLLTLLVINSLAKRVPAIAKVKQTIDTGL